MTSKAAPIQESEFSPLLDSPAAWMPGTYHLFYFLGILDRFARVCVSIAPARESFDWSVLQRAHESIEALFAWEAFYGRSLDRSRHNTEMIRRAVETAKPALGSVHSFANFFVPVLFKGRCDGVIVAGPFLTEPLTPEQIHAEWRSLTGKPVVPNDPGLAAYTRAALNIQVLDPDEVKALSELLVLLARHLAGDANLPSDLLRVAELRRTVFGRLSSSQHWKAGMLVDPVANYTWPTGGELKPSERAELGIERDPNVVVAVMPTDPESTLADVASALLNGRLFQIRCADLARRFDDVLVAPLDEYGAYFLFHVPEKRSPAARKLATEERAKQLAELAARELGVSVTAGVGGIVQHPRDLPASARTARIALQRALHQGAALVSGSEGDRPTSALTLERAPAALLERLVRLCTTGMAAELKAAEAEYVDSVLSECEGRLGSMRIHFEYGLDTLLSASRTRGDVDSRTTQELRVKLRANLRQALTAPALIRSFQDGVRLLSRVTSTPGDARVELKIAEAVRHIEENCHLPLTLSSVARHVGLSKSHFCKCFKSLCESGFSDTLRRARVERAKHLLRQSQLPVQRVSYESGFVSVPHFNRAFKQLVGVTPTEFRG